MLVLHDYALNAGIGAFGDADMVAYKEIGGGRRINDDVIPVGFYDATEIIELLIGDDKIVVVSVAVKTEMVVIRGEAGNIEMKDFLEPIGCAVQEEK